MHKIDERITKEYLKKINFKFDDAILAIGPKEEGIAADGISGFCDWSKTFEGKKYWLRQYENGELFDGARTIVSDMMLVSMGLTVEEAALQFGKKGTAH